MGIPFILFFYKYVIFLRHHFFLHHFSQATISFKISNFLICFCSFDLSCPILEKDNFIKRYYIVLLGLLNDVLYKLCSDLF